MNEVIVKNIIDVIKKSNDKNVITKALVKLRTDVVKDREGIILFRDCEGVIPMVCLLNKPHEKIIEVALSILGNCCTDQDCCKQALENKIIHPLLTILKSVPNPLVQCRACRLLGNLAKENQTQLIPHSSSISQSLCMIIEETSELQTILMAIRAARFFLNDKFFIKNFIRGYGFRILIKELIKLIKIQNDDTTINNSKNITVNSNLNDETNKPIGGLKSCQHREKYFEEVARNLEGVRSDIFDLQILKKSQKQNKNKEFILPEDKLKNDIIMEILKCIQIISETRMNPVILELYHIENNGLSSIVFFIEEKHNNRLYRSITLKILSNFANNIIAIQALCSADAISAACELLTADDLSTPLSENEIRNCINIICMLADDACNRAKIRMNGALKKLIERAKTSNSCTEITMIIIALNHFQYDKISMDLLLREGLVRVLIKELDAYLNATDKYRKEKCEEKKRLSRKRKAEEISKTCYKVDNPKIWADIFEPDSPGSSNSPPYISSPSPCSSRSMSPVNNKHFYEEDYESDKYSPVCSEDESDSIDNDKKIPVEDTDVMKLLDVVMKNEIAGETSDKEDDDQSNNPDTNNDQFPSSKNHPITAIDVIDNLLFRISLHGKNRGELCKSETLKTIIQAMSVFGLNGNSFANSLHNILLESQFFVQILKQDTIHRIYQLFKSEELNSGGMNFFEPLTCVGESGYGRGELEKLLVKSDENVQKRAAIAVSFIIRTPKFLYHFLTENGALYTLLNTILNKNDEYCLEAVDGITSLSQSLGIDIPKSDLTIFNENYEFDETIDFSNIINDLNLNNLNEMKFIIHRGCSKIPIKFYKNLLTQCSDVFNSMLNSDFKECNENEIHLKNYSINGIKYFLNLIKLQSLNKLLNIPPIYHFDSLLEAYELSRMYMIKELEMKLYNMLIYRLCSKTCLKIFQWSLKNFNQELCEITINYYLSSNLYNLDKVQLFHEADYCENSKEWNQMIIDAILVKCQNLCVES